MAWGTTKRGWGGVRPLIAVGLAALALGSVPAVAEAGFRTGLGGRELQFQSAGDRDQWLDKMANETGSKIVRVHMPWSSVVLGEPQDPRNPADHAYFFNLFDATISDIKAHGLVPMLRITPAPPEYATGADPPADAFTAGVWKIQPDAIADFAHVVATRYSGRYEGLPRVKFYQWWNEQNLGFTWQPLWAGRKPIGVRSYVVGMNAFYDEVKRVHGSNKVISGGTAPHGDPAGASDRMRPLVWWREALCLKKNLRPRRSCGPAPKFDILAHHAVSILNYPPWRHALHRDDIATADMGRLIRALRAAERADTVGGPRRHPVWATELWWQTDPPDPLPRAVSARRHANYLADALYVLWKAGTDAVLGLQIRDDPPTATNNGFGPLQTGLYFWEGGAKPGLQGWRFPFVSLKAPRGRTKVWGIAPAAGKLQVERNKGGAWKTVARLNARKGRVFTKTLNLDGRSVLRARVGGQTSLPRKRRG